MSDLPFNRARYRARWYVFGSCFEISRENFCSCPYIETTPLSLFAIAIASSLFAKKMVHVNTM